MPFRVLICLALLLAMAGCNRYDLKVNERVVYTPRPLFSDYAAPDAALAKCLKKAIDSYKVTSAAQLQELDCHGDGIAELTGLQVFTGLRSLRLSDNKISDLSPLVPLSSVEVLDLKDNAVVNPLPLYGLLSLRILDLSGNPDLKCPKRQDLLRVVDLSLPQHCGD